MLENLPQAASSRSVLHSWHLFTCPLAIVEIKRFCKKKGKKSVLRLLRVTFSAPFYLSMCVCAPVGDDTLRMYHLRAVCDECGCGEIAVSDRSDQVILLLHSLRWHMPCSPVLTFFKLCVSEFLHGVLVCHVMTRERWDKMVTVKKKCYRVYKVYINIHIYKYT